MLSFAVLPTLLATLKALDAIAKSVRDPLEPVGEEVTVCVS